MRRDFYHFALWSLLILVGAVVVILYQHASHTGALIVLLNNLRGTMTSPNGGAESPDPSSTISSNPGWSGAASRAAGVWTPIGPPGATVFPFVPPQPGGSAFGGNL
jgi:hypothetical protein